MEGKNRRERDFAYVLFASFFFLLLLGGEEREKFEEGIICCCQGEPNWLYGKNCRSDV